VAARGRFTPGARAATMRAQHTPRLGVAAAAAALLIAAHFAAVGVVRPLVRPDPYSDFATFYSAARCFAAGTDPYDARALRDTGSFGGWTGRYLYPPPFAGVAVRPLAMLPFALARRVWVVLEAAAYVAAAWVTAGVVTTLAPVPRALLAATLVLPFAPMFLDLRLGSVSGILWLCVALAWRARAAARPRRAGFWLALAILLKLAPALLLVYWGARRERRLVAAAIATAVAVVVVGAPWTGFAAYRAWLVEVLPTLSRDSFAWFTNQSLDAFFWRLFVPNPDTTPWIASPAMHHACVAVATLAVACAVVAAARRGGAATGANGVLASATVLAAAPLVARVAWEYLFVLTLPAFLSWAGRIATAQATRREVAWIAVAWFLCAAPFAYERTPPRSGPALLLAAPRTYGALVLVFVSAAALVRRRR
jgi:hypothetical protein